MFIFPSNKNTASSNQENQNIDQTSSFNGVYNNKSRSNWSSHYDVNQTNSNTTLNQLTSSMQQQQPMQHRKLEKTYSYPTRITNNNFNSNNNSNGKIFDFE